MKIGELHLDGDIITVHNNMWTGVESVYFNGQIVCERFAWFFGTHQFNVEDEATGRIDRFRVEVRTSLESATMCKATIYRNDIKLYDSTDKHTRPMTVSRERADNYDRSGWYGEPQRQAQPLYREEDLV